MTDQTTLIVIGAIVVGALIVAKLVFSNKEQDNGDDDDDVQIEQVVGKKSDLAEGECVCVLRRWR